MNRRSLRWLLYPTYLAGMLAALAMTWWLASAAVERAGTQVARESLEKLARSVESKIGSTLKTDDQELQAACQEAIGQGDRRIAIVLASRDESPRTSTSASASRTRQWLVCDTGTPAIQLSDPSAVPEFKEALAGRDGFAKRNDYPVDRRLAHVTIPVRRGGKVIGVVRASSSLELVDRAHAGISIVAAMVAATVVLLAAGFSFLGAKNVAAGLATLRQGLVRFRQGELQYRIKLAGAREVVEVADELNGVATELHERLRGMNRELNSQNAVLTSMAEGVLAIDNHKCILAMNHASCELLGVDEARAKGRSLQEIVRSADLRRFIERALAGAEPIEEDVILPGARRAVLQARGRALHDADGQSIGAVIVLNDVSAFRRLESIRRDFVANVSHELKTPVASIKGFAETLLDGAMHKPEDAQRFLEIIAKQSDRLNAIIEDLLSLSRIEQGEEAASIVFERGEIRQVLEAAVDDRKPTAVDREVNLELACDNSIAAEVNGQLLEQAVTNLIDNAIKYSEPGSYVHVVGAVQNGEVTISVIDRGCGIAAEHIPRIFERFYRVDKARSRKLGGTGLGLAIVKHIVQAHRGRVSVQSAAGEGSTFTLHLPRR